MQIVWQKFHNSNRPRRTAGLLALCLPAFLFAQEGTRPDTLRRKVFTADDAFLWQHTENLEKIRIARRTNIRLERKSASAYSNDDLILDFEHDSLFRNPAQQSLLVRSSMERTAVNQLSGNAALFNLPGHQIRMRLPSYLNLSGKNGEDGTGDFSFFCELIPETANGEILRRENYSEGRQFLLSMAMRNGRLVVRFDNLLVARGGEGQPVFDSVELRSVDKLRQGTRNQVLLTYAEGPGRLELQVNKKEQSVYNLKRTSSDNYALSFAKLQAAPLSLFSPYRGYADNVVFSNRLLGAGDLLDFGALTPYGDKYDQRRGLLLSGIFDMGYSQSSIHSLNAGSESNEENRLQLAYRCSDQRFRANEPEQYLKFADITSAPGRKCRFIQFRAIFVPDNEGSTSPQLRKIQLEYRENPAPERPEKLRILAKSAESVEIEIVPNSELDVVRGGRYIIYYGHEKLKPEGAFYFRRHNFSAGPQGEPIVHKPPVRITLTNEMLAQNKKWADQNPRFRNRYPVFEQGIGYYFWVTACDNAWTEAQEHADHESAPSVPVFVRFE